MSNCEELTSNCKMATADLHTHVVCHKYLYNGYVPLEIDEEDKETIRRFVDEVNLREELDYVAITDHDMLAPSLYGKEYAETKGLRIKIITGAECSTYLRGERIHILALGITEMPEYNDNTFPLELIKRIKDVGGLVILAHPHIYSIEAYHMLKDYVDGIEYYNGGVANRTNSPYPEGIFTPFDLPTEYRKDLILTYGSDYHVTKPITPEKLRAYRQYSREFLENLRNTKGAPNERV